MFLQLVIILRHRPLLTQRTPTELESDAGPGPALPQSVFETAIVHEVSTLQLQYRPVAQLFTATDTAILVLGRLQIRTALVN